jgi:tetratricopeptide (TPR) repeat protein
LTLQDAAEKLRAGNPRAALQSLLPVLAGPSADSQSWYLAGICRFELRELADALDSFERALAVQPANSSALYAAALCLEDLGRPEDALQRYAEAIAT